MVQWLNALTVLPGVQCSIPSPDKVANIRAPGDLMLSSGLHGHCSLAAQTYRQTSYRLRIKINLKKNKLRKEDGEV